MFDFINDDKFRAILERDFKELEFLQTNKASKSVLVLTGSLIEAVLVEYFLSKKPDGLNESEILSLPLGKLLELAVSHKLITQKTKDLSTVVKDYRNLIHPGREVRKNETFNSETSNVAYSLLKIIVSEIRENYLKLYGYTAKDVLQKIESDYLSINIFDDLIEKLSQAEKIKLYHSLFLLEKPFKLKNGLLEKIRPYIPEEIILEKLKHLLHLIETSDSNEVVYYYSFVHSEIGILDETSINLITKYILSFIGNEREIQNVRRFVGQQTFTSVAKYIKTEANQELFIQVLMDFYMYKEKSWFIDAMYRQMIYGLESLKRQEIEEYLENERNNYVDLFLGERFNFEADTLPF